MIVYQLDRCLFIGERLNQSLCLYCCTTIVIDIKQWLDLRTVATNSETNVRRITGMKINDTDKLLFLGGWFIGAARGWNAIKVKMIRILIRVGEPLLIVWSTAFRVGGLSVRILICLAFMQGTAKYKLWGQFCEGNWNHLVSFIEAVKKYHTQ